MALNKSLIEHHISTLEEFETLYGEFLLERRGGDHDWSGEEWARRERQLKMLAPQAEEAFRLAGAKRWDEGPVAIDLPARILNFIDPGDGLDDEPQWVIQGEIVTYIGSLQGKLRRAEEREWDEKRKEVGADFGDLAERRANDPWGFWDMTESQLVNWLGGNSAEVGSPVHEHGRQVLEQKRREADRDRGRTDEHREGPERSDATLEKGPSASTSDPRKAHGLAPLWNDPNPWVLVVVGGIIAAVVAALIIAKLS
jgi:hypothetical protein